MDLSWTTIDHVPALKPINMRAYEHIPGSLGRPECARKLAMLSPQSEPEPKAWQRFWWLAVICYFGLFFLLARGWRKMQFIERENAPAQCLRAALVVLSTYGTSPATQRRKMRAIYSLVTALGLNFVTCSPFNPLLPVSPPLALALAGDNSTLNSLDKRLDCTGNPVYCPAYGVWCSAGTACCSALSCCPAGYACYTDGSCRLDVV